MGQAYASRMTKPRAKQHSCLVGRALPGAGFVRAGRCRRNQGWDAAHRSSGRGSPSFRYGNAYQPPKTHALKPS